MLFGGLLLNLVQNDMREAPSITIINELIKHGASIKAFDPKAFDEAKKIFGDKIYYAKNSYDALENANALLLLTEWNEFRRPNFDKVSSSLIDKVIFDGRNQYEKKRLKERGIEYISMGSK